MSDQEQPSIEICVLSRQIHIFANAYMEENFDFDLRESHDEVALLAICVGNSPVTGEFPAQRPVMWSFDVFFDLRLNKQLSKQSGGWRSDTITLIMTPL